MHMRWLAVPFTLPAALLVIAGFPQLSEASVGVGVQGNPVRLGAVAHPGGSYTLPSVAVINTGTEDETISVRVERLSRGPGLTVPPSWVHATGPDVSLSPQQTARIPLGLEVPTDAKPGTYLSDIVVVGSANVSAGQANLGAAAATTLEFKIVPGAVPGSAIPGWTWWALGLLVILAAAAIGVRRSSLWARIEQKATTGDSVDHPGGDRA